MHKRALVAALSGFLTLLSARDRIARVPLLLQAALVALVLLVSPYSSAKPNNLLASKVAIENQGVRRAHTLTDGVRAAEGDEWDTELTSIFASRAALVVYDLGQVVPISSVYLQGDNNDVYTLLGSEDGKSFQVVWASQPERAPGLRGRFISRLAMRARYLKITASGGDGAYSLSEVQVFSESLAQAPAILARSGLPQGARVRSFLLYFAFGMGVFLLLFYRGSHPALKLVALLAPLISGLFLLRAVVDSWPVESGELSMLRAVCAALGLLALLRERVFRERFPAHHLAVFGTLAVSAVLACATFYNLGRPQYWNHQYGRPEFVHTYDMRVYHPFAKYFRELKYDGVYLASVAAYAEDVRGASLEALRDVEVRSLTTHKLQRVAELHQEIEEVKGRFSEERWQAFKRDMQYFRDVMGPEYLRTLNDHGANATPVWVLLANVIFAWSTASPALLTFGGMVDAFLLAGLFAAIWRTFGMRASLVAMILFGANDLYMFGTNWGGATLRHDWMVFLGFGVCALGAKRWNLAGVCLALSLLIRAFPALALAGVAVPLLFSIHAAWRKNDSIPSLKSVVLEHPEITRVLIAALATIVASLAITSILFSPSSWLNWWEKISMLNSETGTNDVSLRALIAGNDAVAGKLFRLRQPIFLACAAAALALVGGACRKRAPQECALLALPLVFVVMNPSNYYAHFIFLLPLVFAKDNLPRAAAPLLALCIAQYWTTLDPDSGRHFELATVLLFTSLGWFFYNVLSPNQRDE